jgi:hypothetical protein
MHAHAAAVMYGIQQVCLEYRSNLRDRRFSLVCSCRSKLLWKSITGVKKVARLFDTTTSKLGNLYRQRWKNSETNGTNDKIFQSIGLGIQKHHMSQASALPFPFKRLETHYWLAPINLTSPISNRLSQAAR